ncbi:tRNA (cytidine(34)-2'-O)-methyltransferase, partial [Neisseria sp. P0015.S009]|uniref:tRNA (cytidine(34)-2'-O)-methyltransferase n=1 Tax=Neisseria sp. P0015.S009 TaxID=3436765 RepID=UPI003F7E7658
TTLPDEVSFREGFVLLFCPETRGLPAEVLDSLPAGQKIRLPMIPGSRSMNLTNTVAVLLLEAWRQNCFARGV